MFAIDVLACVCGATRRVIATIERGPVSRKILAHLGLAPEPPPLAPAREPAQTSLWGTGPPRRDAPEPLDLPHVIDWDQSLPAASY